MRKLNDVIVLVLILIFSGLAGCGGSSRHDQSAVVTEGVAVDPYIVGATFFEDKNNNAIHDPGEQLSTVTDSSGYFSFVEPVAVGSTLVMKETGTHQGLPFTLILKRLITADDSGQVVVSPLTSLLAAGLTVDELIDLLAAAGLPWINDLHRDDIFADPLTGLENLTADNLRDADLALLRTNFVAYAIIEFVNSRFDELDADAIERTLSREDFATLLFDTIELICSRAMLQAADQDLTGRAAGMPAMTMADVAATVPAILYWWTGQFYEDLINARYDFPLIGDVSAELEGFVLGLAPYYFALNRLDHADVNPADFLAAEFLPLTARGHFMLANDGSGQVRAVDAEIVLPEELFHDMPYVVGDMVLQFHADGSLVSLEMEDDEVGWGEHPVVREGTWSVSANTLQLTDIVEGLSFDLTLVGEWPAFLRFMTADIAFAGERWDVLNLPLIKVRQFDSAELVGETFLIDTDDYASSDPFRGARIRFESFVEGSQLGSAELVDFADVNNPSAPVDWWPAAADHTAKGGNSFIVEGVNETYQFYPFGDERVVIVTTEGGWIHTQGGQLADVDATAMLKADKPAVIRSGVYSVESTFNEELTLFTNNRFIRINNVDESLGSWAYDNTTGELILLSDLDGSTVKIYFYTDSDSSASEYPIYYEEYDSAGSALESGFDRLDYLSAAPEG